MKFAQFIAAFALLTFSAGCVLPRAEATQKQTPRVVTSCFPKRLWAVLRYIERQTGRSVTITSGLRNRGKRHSQHRYCKAADIRVPGISIRRLRSIARSAPGIGGVGTYHGKGILHVDVGPNREWTH